MVGHAGTDFASSATLSSYNLHFDFGIALATNSFSGLNCASDQPAFETQGQHGTITACLVLDAVVRLYGHEGLICETLSDDHQDNPKRAHNRDSSKPSTGYREDQQGTPTVLRMKKHSQPQLMHVHSIRGTGPELRVGTPRKPSSPIPAQLRQQQNAARSGTPAICTWTKLWGSKCEVCEAQACMTCVDVTCSTSIGDSNSCQSCHHSHPYTYDGALSHAGVLPCGDLCAVAADDGCSGIRPSPLPTNASGNWVWHGGSLSFFSDSDCTSKSGPPWNVSGDCSTNRAPGVVFSLAPIPMGHLALGSNGTHATLIFGASAASCNDARLARPQLGILPTVGVGQCADAGVPDGHIYFKASARGTAQ